MSQQLASLSKRAKWGLLALVFAFTQFIPLIKIANTANAEILPSNDVSVASFPFGIKNSSSYSEPGGVPTADGSFKNGNVGAYVEGACIPTVFEVTNTSTITGDIFLAAVFDHYNPPTIGIDNLEPISYGGTSNPVDTITNLNQMSYLGTNFSSATSFKNSSNGNTVANVEGVYSGNSTGTNPFVYGSSQFGHYNITLQDVAADETVYVAFCARLSLDASDYNGSSLSIRTAGAGAENIPIPVNALLKRPSIEVSKVIDEGTALPSDFSFTITPAVNGQSVFTIPQGEDSVLIDNVYPDGAYKIVENGPNGYVFTNGSGTNCDADETTYNTVAGTMFANVAAGKTPTNASCQFTNSVENGSITIIKNAVPNSNQPFSFTASNNLPTSSFNLIDDGVTQDANKVEFGNLSPDQTYTFTEDSVTNWDLKSIVCSGSTNSQIDTTLPTATITLAAGEDISCTFSNEEQGTLTIEKQTLPNGDNAEFEFITSNQETFSLKDNEQKAFAITAGSTFVVDESVKEGWRLTDLTCSPATDSIHIDEVSGYVTFTPQPGESVACVFTNTKLGSITIEKNAIPDSGKEFDFVTTGQGVSDFTLVDDGNTSDTITFTGLLPAEYTFTEEPSDGWELDNISCSGSLYQIDGTKAKILLGAGQNANCKFTNRMYGQIIVEKTTYPSADSQQFAIEATSSDGGLIFNSDTANISDSQPATFVVQQTKSYDIAETVPEGWIQNSNTCKDITVNGNSDLVNGMPTEYCEIVNTKLATIAISKQTNPDGSQEVFDFTASGQKTEQFQLSDGQAKTYLDLVPGEPITITETTAANDGWNLSDIRCTGTVEKDVLLSKVTFTPDPGQNIACTFFNDDTPVLTLIKNLSDNLYGSDAQVDDFILYASSLIDNTNDFNGTSGVNSLDEIGDIFQPGTYNLSESTSVWSTSEYEQGDWICLLNNQEYDASNGEITLNFGDEATCTIENSIKPAKVIVYKKVVNDNGGLLVAEDFSVRLSSEDSYTNFEHYDGTEYPEYSGVAVFDELDANEQFALNENPEHSDQYDITDITCESSFTLANGETVECFITNDDIAPSLELVKEVKNTYGGTAVASDWELKATGSTTISGNGGAASDATFKAGEYTLSEESTVWSTNQYEPSDWICEGDAVNEEDSITLAVGQTAKCTIVNSDIAPHLTVVKDIDKSYNGAAKPDDFSPTVDGNVVESGKTYTYDANKELAIDETLLNGYEFYEITGDEKCPATLGGTITLEVGDNITCTIVNKDLPSDIYITKYWDKNENGIRDDYFNQGQEPVMSGIAFNLYSDEYAYQNKIPSATAITDEYGVAHFEDLPRGWHLIEEATPEGWRTLENTCTKRLIDIERNIAPLHEEENGIPPEAIYLDNDDEFNCTVGNTRDEHVLNLTKTNNSIQAQQVGDIVIYTLIVTVPEESGVLHDPIVTDLPPEGFRYVTSSWTADSNFRGNLKPGISVEPTYTSPGEWLFDGFNKYFDELMTVPNNAFYPGEVITLTYKAKIQEGVTKGVYPDIAFAMGLTYDEQAVYSNLSNAQTPFVGTEVEVTVPDPEPEIVLVNTGAPAIIAILFGALISALGLLARLLAIPRREVQ